MKSAIYRSLRFEPVVSLEMALKLCDLVQQHAKSKCVTLQLGEVLYVQPADAGEVAGIMLSCDPLLVEGRIVVETERRSLAELSGEKREGDVRYTDGKERSMCDICECNVATIQCADCKKYTRLCKDCYMSSHKGEKKRTHRIASLAPVAAVEEEKDSEYCANFKCKVHPTECRRFICTRCNITVCSLCLLAGEHEGHAAVAFSEVANHVVSMYGQELEEHTARVAQLRRAKDEAVGKQKLLADSLAAAKTLVRCKFVEVEDLVQEKRHEVLGMIERGYGSKLHIPDQKIGRLLGDCQDMLANVKSILEESSAGTITQDRFDSLCATEKEQQQQGRGEGVQNGISDMLQSVYMVPEQVPPIEFDLQKVELALRPVLPVDRSIGNPAGITDVKAWRTLRSIENPGWNAGIAYDLQTGECFVVAGSDGNQVFIYHCESDIWGPGENVATKIPLEQNCAGTYFAVSGGYLYYPAKGSATVLQVEIHSGKLRSEAKLPNAGFGRDPTSVFNCGGLTDIAVMQDPLTGLLYVMYQEVVKQECRLQLLLETPGEISLGETWLLPGKKKAGFGFAFVKDGMLYLGSRFDKPVVDYIFNLRLNKWEKQPEIQLPGEFGAITHVMAVPGRNLFVCDQKTGIFLLEPGE